MNKETIYKSEEPKRGYLQRICERVSLPPNYLYATCTFAFILFGIHNLKDQNDQILSDVEELKELVLDSGVDREKLVAESVPFVEKFVTEDVSVGKLTDKSVPNVELLVDAFAETKQIEAIVGMVSETFISVIVAFTFVATVGMVACSLG